MKAKSTQSKKKNVYKKLLNIKSPVMVFVEHRNKDIDNSRFRILYPDGRCDFTYLTYWKPKIRGSCFMKEESGIKNTVKLMKQFDKECRLKIVKVVKL